MAEDKNAFDKNVNNNNKHTFSARAYDESNIDKEKINKIKRELNAVDFEDINKNIAKEQAESGQFKPKDGKYLTRNERIKQKNDELMQQIYRQNRILTEQLAQRKKESLNVILTVLILLLLLGVLIMGVFLYLEKVTRYDDDYIRVSVSMTNKDIFYDTVVEGELIPKDVSPGDTFSLNIIARNSNSITGDEGDEWTSIYIRFRIFLKVNGVEYPEFIYIEPNAEIWEKYNKEIEDTYLQSESNPVPVVTVDDGYYYCRLILRPNEQVTVIDKLRFSEKHITEAVGGNKAVLEVEIEALDASVPQVLKDRTVWENAPQNWVLYMTDPNNHPGSGEESPVTPEEPINVWWIILFIILAILLIATLAFVTTRKRVSKKKIADMNRKINKRQ